ncbi:MAG TPA: hypothetical protein VGM28_09305 [Candidatus Limnocylindrales bacterium]|jgi:hypothetical protein
MTDQTPPDPTPPPSMEPAAAPPPVPVEPAPAAPAPAPAAAPTSWAPPASAAASGTAARPTGITILAVLAAIGGVFALLAGFVIFLGATVIFGGLGAILGLAFLAYAGLIIAFAYGAWTLQPWAWPLGVAGAAFGIVLAVLNIIGGSSIVSQIIGIAIDGGIIYYLNQPGIRAVFGRA